MENEFKSCPYCGEKIQKEAKKCRFCGEWLTDDTRKAAEIKEKAEEKAELQKWLENRKAKRSGAGVMTVFLLILFLVCFWGGIAYIVHLAVPSDERMERAIMKDVQACVKDKAVSFSGLFGEEAGALTSMFLATDASAQSINEIYQKYNATVIERSWLWSVGKICNYNSPDGVNVCFGMFGIVIPYVAWEDFVLTDTGQGTYEYSKRIQREDYENNPATTKNRQSESMKEKVEDNLKKELTRILEQWDTAHNKKYYSIFNAIYADNVLFYGQKLTMAQCIANKQKLLDETYQTFTQHSNNVYYQEQDDGSILLSFDKHVEYDGKSRIFPSYLIVRRNNNGAWKIIAESDKITDKNLRKN